MAIICADSKFPFVAWQGVTVEVKRAVPLRQVFEQLGWRTYHGKRADCGLCDGSKRETIAFSDSKGLWRCHRCGEGGDIFTLIQEAHGLKFPDALKYLAAEARIPLERQQDPREYARLCREADKRQRRRDAVSSAAQQLKQNERALLKWCRSWIHFCDDVLAMPGPWSEEQWQLARMAGDLRDEYLLPEYTLLSFGAARKCKQYLEANELGRIAMLVALRNRGGVVTDNGRFEEVIR